MTEHPYPEGGLDTVSQWVEWLKQCPPRQALEEVIHSAIWECAQGECDNAQFLSDAAKHAAQRIIELQTN